MIEQEDDEAQPILDIEDAIPVASTQESSMLVEQIQDKNDEIERLQDLLEKEKELLS